MESALNESLSGAKRPKLTEKHGVLNDQGFSLVEIIIVVVLLAISIIPMVRAYVPAILSTGTEHEMVVFTNQARGTLNRIIALDFETLYSNQGYSVDLVALFGSPSEAAKETFSLKGNTYTPVVDITDESAGAGGLLRITVTIRNQVSLDTLRADY